MNLTKNLIRARTVDQKSWISDFEASFYLNLIRNLTRAGAIDQNLGFRISKLRSN